MGQLYSTIGITLKTATKVIKGESNMDCQPEILPAQLIFARNNDKMTKQERGTYHLVLNSSMPVNVGYNNKGEGYNDICLFSYIPDITSTELILEKISSWLASNNFTNLKINKCGVFNHIIKFNIEFDDTPNLDILKLHKELKDIMLFSFVRWRTMYWTKNQYQHNFLWEKFDTNMSTSESCLIQLTPYKQPDIMLDACNSMNIQSYIDIINSKA